jgi:hypothetical protein
MTTISSAEEACFVCGKSSEHTVINSTNEFGSPDLDLRPPPMARQTISHWIKRCPFCGYCASTLSEGPEIAKRVVRSSEYIEQLNSADFPQLADQFLCWALIQVAAGEASNAGWAALHAAWACDDAKTAHGADVCRRKAIALFVSARAKAQTFSQDGASESLLLADLYRRTGQLEQVARVCAEGLAQHPKDPLPALFAAQQQMARAGDRAAHTVQEVLKKTSGE